MPRPQNKQELCHVLQFERTKHSQALVRLTAVQKLQKGACGEWSVKDILAHLVDLLSPLRIQVSQQVDPGFHQGHQGRVSVDLDGEGNRQLNL